MSEGRERSEKLERALIQFLDHSKERDIKSDLQMEALTETVKETQKSLGELALVVAASEQRHVENQKSTERIGTAQQDLSEKFEGFKDETRKDITVIQKQVMLLEKTEESLKERWAKIDGVFWKIVGAIALFVVGGWFTFGNKTEMIEQPKPVAVTKDLIK